jgi:hypothetical protein
MRAGTPVVRALYSAWDGHTDGRTANGREVNPQFVVLPRPESAGALWLEAAVDGVVLWERSHQVADLLRELRSRIAAGFARRQLVHGQPYWVRNDHAES